MMAGIYKNALIKNMWGARKQCLWICVIPAILISRICWYGIQQPYIIYPDSTQYIRFDTLEVLRGNLNATDGRPPLYGIFLDLMGTFFGESYLSATKFVQILVSFLSIVVFAKLLRRLGVSSPCRELCVFLYGVTPAVAGWDNAILTESFSLSGTVMFFYWIVLYIQNHQLRYGVLAHLMVFALVFLRPQFLVYLALLLTFLVLKFFFPFERAERKRIVTLLLLQVVLWGGIWGYCVGFEKATGVFSLTTASPIQNMRVCIDRGYYADFDDEKVKQFIEQKMEELPGNTEVFNATAAEFGIPRCGEVAQHYFSTHFSTYVIDTIDVMINDLQTRFCGYGLYSDKINTGARGIFYKTYALQMGLFGIATVAHALIFSALEGVAMAIVWVRRRSLPWIHMALFSISICTTVTTYFVTCGEYMRTMISVVPYLYCMMGMFLQMCASQFVHQHLQSV